VTARTPEPDVTTACVCGRLRRASRALTQLYDDLMAPCGLRVTQFSLLRTLARSGTSLRISELANLTLIDRTALSRNLDPLSAQGLVEIVPGDDARTREVRLTRAGRSALAKAMPLWQRAQVEVAQRIGDRKIDALVGLLADVEQLHPAPEPRR